MGSNDSLLVTVGPVLIIVVALVGCFRPAVALTRMLRLTSRGKKAQGEVLSSYLHEDGTTSRLSRAQARRSMSETIEFTTSTGTVVRANPAASDIGMVDRTGMPVTVISDRERPDMFVAPRNGERISPWQTLAGIGTRLVMVVVGAGLLVIGGGISGIFGSRGGLG